MRVRKTDASGDMTFGKSAQNIYVDDPLGVGQIVASRLNLWTGQWFLAPSQGTAWKTRVLGKYTGATADPTIQARILGTPNVTELVGYNSALDRDTRKWTVNAQINTTFGKVQIAGPV